MSVFVQLTLLMATVGANTGNRKAAHARIAALWSAYLNYQLTAHDVAILMVLLKVARIMGKTFNADNYVDVAGYAGIAAELATNANA